MSLRTFSLGAVGALFLAGAAWAGDGIEIRDAYMRASRPNAPTGAAFMVIVNHGDTPDRLLGVASDAAARVELHTHRETGDGVMRMSEVPEGFEIPAGGERALARGGDHVMFMGLSHPLEDGARVAVTLRFEQAGDMTVEIPVDLSR